MTRTEHGKKIAQLERELSRAVAALRSCEGPWEPGDCECPAAAIVPTSGYMMYYRCNVCGKEYSHGSLKGPLT